MGSTASSAAPASAHMKATDGAAYWSIGVSVSSPVTSPRTLKRENDYYYTLVFANTKAVDDDAADGGIAGSDERVSYGEALATLRSVTGGGMEREARVEREFRSAWMTKFRTPSPALHDSIPWGYFQELLRELIVQRFDEIPDLFLKTSLSEDGRSLIINFRPSRALLCQTADRLRIKVAVMAEVDPGERYWAADPTRATGEAYQWSRADAQEELYRMFLGGKISAEEAQIYDLAGDREDAGMWSRRIHALRRFFDPDVAKIVAEQESAAMTSTTATTFLPYKSRDSLRYLYRQIDGAGDDATPFRVVDKIRLTKAIIDTEFDCDALVEKGLLLHHCCTHTHHTDAIDTSIDVLQAQWGALSSPWCLYRQGVMRFSQLLHYQPLGHVRNYFGEELAVYFAYTSFYAHALQWLCVAAVAAAVLHRWSVSAVQPNWNYIAFALINTAFAQTFVRKWAIQERVHATHWGVALLQDVDLPRPQFRGQLAVSPITHRLETFYSPQRRQLQQLASSVLLLTLCLGLLAVDFILLTSDVYTRTVASNPVLVHVGVTIVSKLLTSPCALLCTSLTEWENYRSQNDFDVNLTLKFAIMQSVNLFGVLWLQTFVLPVVWFASSQEQSHMCLQQAAHLLTTFLGVDFTLSLWDLRGAALANWKSLLPSWLRRASATASSDRGEGGDRARLLSASPTASSTTTELALDPYEGVMFDYAQVIITFGFVAWFAALSPITTVLAWAVAVLQIRVDAFKLCHLTQRPFPAQKNSIGSWGTYLRFLALGSWLHNAMLSVLYMVAAVPTELQDLGNFVLLHDVAIGDEAESERLQTETLLLVVFAGFGVVAFLAGVHDQSDRARLKQLRWLRLRQRFLENKYINNLDRVPDSVREGLPCGRVFLNGVHCYVVTGNKAEEDAAEEVLDELLQLQVRSLQLQRQIAEMRTAGAAVGTLVVDVGSINILPVMDALTKAVDSFLQLQLVKGDADGAPRDGGATGKTRAKDKPVNTSVIKKQRSPTWTETFELSLRSLDEELFIRVYDWELLGKNRRIGHTTLRVADVVATAPPVIMPTTSALPTTATHDPAEVVPPRATVALSFASDATTVVGSPMAPSPPPSPLRRASLAGGRQPSPTHATKVRMASFEIPIEMPDVLLSTMHADLVRHGHPKLSLRCGVQLDALGRVLLQQRHLQHKIRQLQDQEKQFFEWK